MRTHVASVAPDATVGEAIDLMDLYQCIVLPVVDAEGCLCGVISEHDVTLGVLSDSSLSPERAANGVAPSNVTPCFPAHRRVGEMMRSPAIAVTEGMTLDEAARLMLAHGLKRLPVVSEAGALVGVLSRIELCQAVSEGML